jgi:hypothetical protein
MQNISHFEYSNHSRHRYNLALLCRMKYIGEISGADPKLIRAVALANMLDTISEEIGDDLYQWSQGKNHATSRDGNDKKVPNAHVDNVEKDWLGNVSLEMTA